VPNTHRSEEVSDIKKEIDRFKTDFDSITEEIGKVIVGNRDIVEKVLIAFFAKGHVLLEGVPGMGKTLLVKSLSKALGFDFKRIQFTPDLMPADITGTPVEKSLNLHQVLFLLMFCWQTKLTVQRQRHNRPCWKPWRKDR